MLTTPTSEPVLPGLRRAVKRTLFTVRYYHHQLADFDFPGVAVLCYHSVRDDSDTVPFQQLHVTRSMFERHCRFLAETCNPISLADLRAARAGARPLPPRPVIVTFDDGYRSVLDCALPSLQRLHVPAAVFVCAGAIIDARHFWFDVLHTREGEEAVVKAKQAEYADWHALYAALLTPADVAEHHRPMTVDELRRLAASPLIEIGAHTMIHPTLARVPMNRQRHEIVDCRAVLQDLLRQPVNAFAYPYGSRTEDYIPDTVVTVREAGYDLAFATGTSFASLHGDAFQIPRFVMLDSIGEAELAHRLLYSWHVKDRVV